jgi:hypothetical protein
MNKQITYAKSSMMKGFVNNDDWMENNLVPFSTTSTMTKDELFTIANKNRDNCSPIFADENKYLPTNVVSGDAGALILDANVPTPKSIVTVPTTQATIVDTSKPPQKISKELVNGILIGLGVVVLFKILA